MPDRIRAAEGILREAGVAGRVTAEGHDGSIAAIRVSAAAWAELTGDSGRAISERIRALGFRYVALDLSDAVPTDGTSPTGDDDPQSES
jgi:PP-loop superfamily ATP-utilizing enzyme